MRVRKILGWLIVAMLGFLFVGPGTAVAQATITFDDYLGTGFSPGGSEAGSLDSNRWAVEAAGSSSISCDFGETCMGGNYGRGTSDGGVGTGGVYAFTNVGPEEITILGVQPSGAVFVPDGWFTLRLQNTTGSIIEDVYIAYDIWSLNDQNRATSLTFSYSTDNVNFVPVPGFDFTTPTTADLEPEWEQAPRRAATIEDVNLADEGYIYLRWTFADANGNGSRDELGINNIEVRIGGPTAVSLATFSTATNQVSTPLILLLLLIPLAGASLFFWRRAGSSASAP